MGGLVSGLRWICNNWASATRRRCMKLIGKFQPIPFGRARGAHAWSDYNNTIQAANMRVYGGKKPEQLKAKGWREMQMSRQKTSQAALFLINLEFNTKNLLEFMLKDRLAAWKRAEFFYEQTRNSSGIWQVGSFWCVDKKSWIILKNSQICLNYRGSKFGLLEK